MLVSSRVRRLLAAGACAGLVFAIQTSVGGPADATVVNVGAGFSYEVTGGPFSLAGDNGVNCADPANATAPAHLNHGASVKVNYPAGTSFSQVLLGQGTVYYYDSVTTYATAGSITVNVPATGGYIRNGVQHASRFTCADAHNGGLLVGAYVTVTGHGLQYQTSIPLTSVS